MLLTPVSVAEPDSALVVVVAAELKVDFSFPVVLALEEEGGEEPMLVTTPPCTTPGADAAATLWAAFAYALIVSPLGGLTTPTMPSAQCSPREQ